MSRGELFQTLIKKIAAFFDIREDLRQSVVLTRRLEPRNHIEIVSTNMLQPGRLYFLRIEETENYRRHKGPLHNTPRDEYYLLSNHERSRTGNMF